MVMELLRINKVVGHCEDSESTAREAASDAHVRQVVLGGVLEFELLLLAVSHSGGGFNIILTSTRQCILPFD